MTTSLLLIQFGNVRERLGRRVEPISRLDGDREEEERMGGGNQTTSTEGKGTRRAFESELSGSMDDLDREDAKKEEERVSSPSFKKSYLEEDSPPVG